MQRVYLNRRDGEQRIHVELDAREVQALLEELSMFVGAFDEPEPEQFLRLLWEAHRTFNHDNDARNPA